jgi:hypothetical protein
MAFCEISLLRKLDKNYAQMEQTHVCPKTSLIQSPAHNFISFFLFPGAVSDEIDISPSATIAVAMIRYGDRPLERAIIRIPFAIRTIEYGVSVHILFYCVCGDLNHQLLFAFLQIILYTA